LILAVDLSLAEFVGLEAQVGGLVAKFVQDFPNHAVWSGRTVLGQPVVNDPLRRLAGRSAAEEHYTRCKNQISSHCQLLKETLSRDNRFKTSAAKTERPLYNSAERI
jgi:hypothetical protein